MKKLLILSFILLSIASCSSSDKLVAPEYEEKSIQELYNEAKNLLDQELYISASKAFDEVERQHPYSYWATKAQLMSAYSYYKALKYDDALLSLDRYIELHPADKDIAYAYYLRSLCYYEQIGSVKKDQDITKLALYSLEDVVKRYPESSYAKDAKLKIDLANNNLAGQQMSIGRYYLKRKFYNAAINRFKSVIDNYQTTVHIEEALYRLVESYLSLGIEAEARRNAAVLGYNYSGSEWYDKAYKLLKKDNILQSDEKKDSWFKR